jgi:hypothetical protein
MAQLRPTQWARQEDLKRLAARTEEVLREVVEEVSKVANLNTAVLEIQQALFEGDELDDEGRHSSMTKEMWDSDSLANQFYDEQADIMLHMPPEEESAEGEGMIDRRQEIAEARKSARGEDPVAAFESANEGTTAELAALDNDPNAIGGLPDEGILISPGEVTPGLTDLGGGDE